MIRVRLIAAACAALLSVPFAASAQEEAASPISWEIGAVSDYVFRGVSQTDENPTAQVGITYTSPIGVYVGSWASGVDFGAGSPDIEADYFVGYNWAVSDAVNIDFMLNHYTYPGASEMAYNELITTATFAEHYKASVGYSNDVFNSSSTAMYYSVGGEWPLPQDFSVSANIGRSIFNDNVAANAADYSDWNVGVGKKIGMVDLSLGYFGTDGKGREGYGEVAHSRVVLAVKVSQ